MKKYKAAVIGLGNIGLMYDFEQGRPHPSSHVLAYECTNGFQLVCGIDTDVEKEKALKEIAPAAVFFSSLEEALETEVFQSVEIVSICTPPETHLLIIEQLVKQKKGLILFCEKPLVENRKEAEKLVQLVAEHTDITLIPNISRRWNRGIHEIAKAIQEKEYGKLEKINIRYTRGIYNTGSHLFDLLKMWTGMPVHKIMALNETHTSAYPEKSYSFYLELEDGVTGYAEALNDDHYYLFDIDLYCSDGKIEMRNSGDDIFYYRVRQHHLFKDFKELYLIKHNTNVLSDACIQNAINNIENYLINGETLLCSIEDAIYPIYVAEALERSCQSGVMEDVLI